MKAFVYDKKTNKTLLTVLHIFSVHEIKDKIAILTEDNIYYEFNTKEVKTRIYQN